MELSYWRTGVRPTEDYHRYALHNEPESTTIRGRTPGGRRDGYYWRECAQRPHGIYEAETQRACAFGRGRVHHDEASLAVIRFFIERYEEAF